MRRILGIAWLNLLELFRDRSELVSVIVLPLLLTWVFGTAFGASGAERPLKVPVADLDATATSKLVVSAIDEPKGLEVDAVDEATALERVKAGDAPLAVIIPKGFAKDIAEGRTVSVRSVRDPQSNNAQAILEVVQSGVSRVAVDAESARIAGAALLTVAPRHGLKPGPAPVPPIVPFDTLFSLADGLWSPSPPVGVSAHAANTSAAHGLELKAPANTQYSLGFTVFFVLMVAMGSAGGILEERELGTLRRLLATPASRTQIVMGKVLGVAAVAAFEASILVGMGVFVFRVPWGSSPLAVLVLLGALVMAATGLGIMLSALVRTRSQLSALTPVLSTALAMLGGCYWPLEIVSPTMQRIALATPTGWAMTGLKDVVARGAGVSAVLTPAAVLLGMAALFFAVGISRLRLE